MDDLPVAPRAVQEIDTYDHTNEKAECGRPTAAHNSVRVRDHKQSNALLVFLLRSHNRRRDAGGDSGGASDGHGGPGQ